MGSGSTAERIAYGTASGEARAIQEHERVMIPIIQARGEMELELQRQMFEQKYEQSEKLNTLPMQLESRERALDQPVFMPAAPAAPAVPKNVIYLAIAIAVYLFLR